MKTKAAGQYARNIAAWKEYGCDRRENNHGRGFHLGELQ